jgi:sulfofructosephosphate aldolase
MTQAPTAPHLGVLARPSGGFAMLAVDQREAMRAMFAEYQDAPVPDEQVTAFKLAATRTLSPFASGVLLDRQFVLDRAIDENAVDPNCALIAAADEFIPGAEEIVADTCIDSGVDPAHYRARGAAALKLLVIYRPDTDPGKRVEMVEEFVASCRRHGLLSIIEPVSRAPRSGRDWDWDWDAGVVAAAEELGSCGADLYKAEVPRRGQGDADAIRRGCAAIEDAVSSPWVVLSSGVPQDDFPRAVELACAEGASGFLAGRAVWQSCIGRSDADRALQEEAVPRLERLCAVVDDAVAGR